MPTADGRRPWTRAGPQQRAAARELALTMVTHGRHSRSEMVQALVRVGVSERTAASYLKAAKEQYVLGARPADARPPGPTTDRAEQIAQTLAKAARWEAMAEDLLAVPTTTLQGIKLLERAMAAQVRGDKLLHWYSIPPDLDLADDERREAFLQTLVGLLSRFRPEELQRMAIAATTELNRQRREARLAETSLEDEALEMVPPTTFTAAVEHEIL